ncbi:Protein NRT1/ PTR FAMILY 3.1 [Camellia lanceoleosa]|uniref:Protein NRT1/ PTR FAMILY 3.1 n=1 Tax=Camellia lanceoleosa TaxID=1840588 RepID=A0ACC0GCX9_9ERIC|nr:Protein NRT1/ PTR FAMILY 3.1 [Camellia lanceoleosa]
MGIGFAINSLGTLVATIVEVKRKHMAAKHNLLDIPTVTIPMSVFWLIPQYLIHGIAMAFVPIGRMEFFYDQSPESMRSTAASFFWIANAIGSYIGTMMVSLIHKYTGSKRNWVPDWNLNRGRLEYYYMFVSGLQVVNLIYYLICTRFYTYKALEEVSDEDGNDGDVELAIENIGPKPVGEANGNEAKK